MNSIFGMGQLMKNFAFMPALGSVTLIIKNTDDVVASTWSQKNR